MFIVPWFQPRLDQEKKVHIFKSTKPSIQPHQVRNMNGKTPIQAFNEGLALVPPELESEDLAG
jgi:hypothetical protein